MLSIFNVTHKTWENETTSVDFYELFADTATDLPTDPYYFSSNKGSFKIAHGSIAWVIDVAELYMFNSSNTWVLQEVSGGGGGGGGTDNYNALSNKPKINNVTLSSNKTSSDLGLQPAITNEAKVSSDLIDDTNHTNKFVTSTDITTWNAKQDALVVGTNLDDTPTNLSTNPITSGGVYTSLSNKVDVVSGKGLSANDFTDAFKTKLEGIASGAEVNVQSDWNVTDDTSDAYIKNKPTVASTSVTAGKTIASWSETDGVVAITTQDIAISASQAGLGNVTNDAQVKKISSSTSGDLVTWAAATGDTVADSGKSIETSLTANSNDKIPTSKAVADYVGNVYPKLTYVTEDNQSYIAIDYGS